MHVARLARALAFAGALACHGCASSPPFVNDDAAPDGHFDASGIPDAVPRAEPRSPYGNPKSYVVFGERYHVRDSAAGFTERGTASWYGTKFHGRRTSSGEAYDMYAMTAAHKTLPLPTYVRVTNLNNGRSVVVRVNDRGPFHDGRIIDLSYAAALKLDVVATGTAPVEIVALEPGDSAAAATTTPPPAPGTAVFIQLGAFSEADNALGLKGRLESAGIQPVRIDAEPQGESQAPLFRVRLGPFSAAAAADEMALQLVAFGITEFTISRE